MSYLKFDKNLMINLEQSLPKEMLRTNQSGAYHCTTIVDCNTRKQHGLLVIPIPEMDDDNHVLLSSLDETVIQHGAPFNLGLHKYGGNCFSPNGHKYIREFDCEHIPANRILIRYTLVDAHSQTTLQFRPFLAFRNANDLCVENGMASREYHEVTNGIATCMYPGYPTLVMQFNKKPEFVFNPNWYKGIEYIKDQERGIPYREDLYVPGYFQLEIKKGESIIFSAGTSEADTEQFADKFENNPNDQRWIMWCKDTQGFSKENTDFSTFTDGYGVVKFTNLLKGNVADPSQWNTTDNTQNWSTANGGIYDPVGGSAARAQNFPDTDLPLLRLADVYLMYTEANIMGGAGNANEALNYVNLVRARAGLQAWTQSDLTADNILDERCRELYWELTRRSDLVRHGKFSGSAYNWSWKSNEVNGAPFAETMDLFPIPQNVIAAQPEFNQNPGY